MSKDRDFALNAKHRCLGKKGEGLSNDADKHIYLINCHGGDWDGKYIYVLGFVETQEEAEENVKALTEHHAEVCKNAIKNTYYPNKSLEYSELLDEFTDYIRKNHFPHIKSIDELDSEHLTDEEINRLNELLGNYDNEMFKRWLLHRKNITEEIAEATIEFNSVSDYDTFTYRWEKINKL